MSINSKTYLSESEIDLLIANEPQSTAEESLNEYYLNIKDPLIANALASNSGFAALYAKVLFSEDPEERRTLSEGYLDAIHLLLQDLDDNPGSHLCTCIDCGKIYIESKRAVLCDECKKKRDKETRKRRMQRPLEKALIAADTRIKRRFGESSDELIGEKGFRHTRDEKLTALKNKEISEQDVIEWAESLHRIRAPKKSTKNQQGSGSISEY